MDSLLAWLRITDLENAEPAVALDLVSSALDEIEDDHPAYAWLVALETELESDSLPLRRLQRFCERFSEPQRPADACQQLEQEYRKLAEDLTAKEWKTSRLRRIFAWLEGEDEDLEDLRRSILATWEEYQSISIAESEVTAETVVGHRLLLDGLEGWLEALDLLESAESDEQQQEALGVAVYANRLLVAVQRLHQQVESEAKGI